MNHAPQTIPEYAEQIAEWLEQLASEPGQVHALVLRYVAEHVRQDMATLAADHDERVLQTIDNLQQAYERGYRDGMEDGHRLYA